MSFKKHYRREFLNKKEGTALVETAVETILRGKEPPYINGYVSITDCSRKITLEFSSDNKKENREAVAKLDRLIRELQEFRGALVTAGKVHTS